MPEGCLCRCVATGENEILQIHPVSEQSSCKQFLTCLAVPNFHPVLSRQRIFPYNLLEHSLFRPDDRTHSKLCFCLLLLCSSFVVKFSVLHSVFKLFLSGIAKNLCQCISKINNPYLFRLVGPMIFLCLEPSYRILRLIVRHCSSRFTSCHARPQASPIRSPA